MGRSSSDEAAELVATPSTTKIESKNEQKSSEHSLPRRKRRSRWGIVCENGITTEASKKRHSGGNETSRKRTKKIRIPIEEHPHYNFIGLIIGPRGRKQKELEAKTGCRISIRGRGSLKKEGSDDEPLHVVITGDDQQSVDAATELIEQLLVVPVDYTPARPPTALIT